MDEREEINCGHCDKRSCSMFRKLCAEDIDLLDSNKSCRSYGNGSVIFREGARPRGVYCIYKGKIKVSKLGANGKDQIVTIFKEGDLMGYRSIIAEDPYPVTAITLEPSLVCFIPKTEFLSMLHNMPDLYNRIIRALGHEVGAMVNTLTDLAQKSVRQRLAMTLLMLKDTYSLNGFDEGPVIISMSREDLANIVGTATETLIRILRDFKDKEFIRSKGRKIKVLNPEALAREADILA